MKTRPAIRQILALCLTALLAGHLGFGQSADGQSGRPPRLDPVTGMVLPDDQTHTSSVPFERSRSFDPNLAPLELHQLLTHDRYAEALQLCHDYHDLIKDRRRCYIISDWIELGRRYPKARADLVEIRDQDLREFSEGRGYCDLFQEISAINQGWNLDDSTYALFSALRDKDSELAQQCFPYAEDVLVAKGEYQYCRDHMGDPQGLFEVICKTRDSFIDLARRHKEMYDETVQKMATANQRKGLSNAGLPTYSSGADRLLTQDLFISDTRQLIEILVATGDKAEAEKIRDQAVARLNDARLKSAVSDAENKIQKLSVPKNK